MWRQRQVRPEIDADQPRQAENAQTLSGALSGKITFPTSTPVAADTKGAPSVGDDGSASYNIPIWVPEGVRGLKPSLSINYNSEGGAGILGPKWSIQGLSVVTRVPQSYAVDAAQSGLSFQGDAFALDGVRLIRTSGGPTQIGSFVLENDPSVEVAVTISTTAGVQNFQVRRADGPHYYYGTTQSSRLCATVPQNWVAPQGSVQACYAFYLDTIQDRYGNSILISYENQVTSGAQAQDLVPTTIVWGNNGATAGKRSVTFGYVSPANTPDPLHNRFINGMGIYRGQRLKTLTIAGPGASNTAQTLKVYTFSYTAPSITNEQLLSSIQESDGQGFSKLATTINWQPGSFGFRRVDLKITDVEGTAGIYYPLTTGAPTSPSYDRLIAADLNGDGRDDLIYRKAYTETNGKNCLGWAVRLATSSAPTYGSATMLSPISRDGDFFCTPQGGNSRC